MAHILIVDDDGHIREVIRFALEQAGHQVQEAADGRDALAQFRQRAPDLVVLDVLMPDKTGLDVCRELRADSAVPILFVSSRDDEIDRVLGLELGGDDYITKPFSPRELVARVGAALRRTQMQSHPGETQAPSTQLTHGALQLDTERHRVSVAGHEVKLTVAEFSLLAALMRSSGRALSRSQLVQLAYGHAHHLTDRTVDSHIRGIRQKLGADLGAAIETVYGVGYRFADTP